MPYEVKGTETPEELKAAIAQLNDSETALKNESIKHRLEAKGFKEQVAAYQKVLTHPEKGTVLTPDQVAEIVEWDEPMNIDDRGNGGDGGGDDRYERLKAQMDADAKRREDAYNKRIADLEGKAKAAEEKSAAQAREAFFNEIVSARGLTGDAAELAKVQMRNVAKQNEDGTWGITTKDKLGESFVPLAPEMLDQVPGLKILMPKVGASGTAGGSPRAANVVGGVDWDRYKSDTNYRNDPKIKEMALAENKRLIGQA